MQQDKEIIFLTVEIPARVEKLTQEQIIVSISPSKDSWVIKNIK